MDFFFICEVRSGAAFLLEARPRRQAFGDLPPRIPLITRIVKKDAILSASAARSVVCCSVNLCLFVSIRDYYGWIWLVQRNCQLASALIATETANSEISGTDRFGGPLPVSTRNIHGNKIMA